MMHYMDSQEKIRCVFDFENADARGNVIIC